MGQEDTCKETNNEDGLVKISSLVEQEGVKVSLHGVFYDSVDCDLNAGDGVSEGVGNIEKGVKRSDDIVCFEGDGVKSGEMLSVECGGDKNCVIVDGEGDGIVGGSEVSGFVGECGISGTLSIDSDGTKCGEKVSDGENSDGESDSKGSSESDSEGSSESESLSSSEEEDDGDVEVDNDGNDDGEMMEKAWEAGEMSVERMIDDFIEDFIVQELLDWSDEVKLFAMAGLIMSANEVLPSVPSVDVALQPCHKTLPVGFVVSVVGAQVIVEGVEKHDPLHKGSILWITKKRSPLGIVYDIFGPVKNPFYIVRYNSDNEVPAGIRHGTLISFVPEFMDHVLNNGNLFKERYDASVDNDEDLSDEAEFSDDEKEAEYKRMQKVSKRGPKAQIVENRKDIKNKAKRRGDQHLSATQPHKRVGQVTCNQSRHFPQSSSLDRGNCSNSLCPVQAFLGGPGFVPMFPQVTQFPGFVAPSSGFWMNDIPYQQPQSMGFPNVSTPNNILQLQQNHAQQTYQLMSFDGMPPQLFSTGHMPPSNFVLPGGQPSVGAGAIFTPMNPMMMGLSTFQLQAAMSQYNFSQSQAAINMQGQHGINFSQAHAPVRMQGQLVPAFITRREQGVLLTGCQSEQDSNSQPLPGTLASTGDSPNISYSVGVGLARNSYRKGGGQSGGGRGRRQSR